MALFSRRTERVELSVIGTDEQEALLGDDQGGIDVASRLEFPEECPVGRQRIRVVVLGAEVEAPVAVLDRASVDAELRRASAMDGKSKAHATRIGLEGHQVRR